MHLRKPETFVFKYPCFGSKLKKQLKHPSLLKNLSGKLIVLVWPEMNEITCWLIINIRIISTKQPKFDVITKNLDTRVAFDFLGQVVSTNPMKVIIENSGEKRLMNLVDQDLS
uniref:Uncharacterized protein n=1 Tax=Lactuca sativa TaxID=4236 RepID=A0A9R1XPL6_LACSA|nr:hypothetical protein LSAT_V11C300107160 [Lactuca sativa]